MEYKLSPKAGSLLFIVLGAGIGLYGAWEVKAGLATKNWPTTSGVITESRVRSRTRTTGTGSERRRKHRHEAIVHYRYEAGGLQRTGTRVAYGIHGGSRYSRARRITERYDEGDTVTVHYHPTDPAKAVLETGAKGTAWLSLIGGIVAFVGGLGVLIAGKSSGPAQPGRRKPIPHPPRQT